MTNDDAELSTLGGVTVREPTRPDGDEPSVSSSMILIMLDASVTGEPETRVGVENIEDGNLDTNVHMNQTVLS